MWIQLGIIRAIILAFLNMLTARLYYDKKWKKKRSTNDLALFIPQIHSLQQL